MADALNIDKIFNRLLDIKKAITTSVPLPEVQKLLKESSPVYKDSAINLIHYLALRSQPIEDLQESLTSLGLSSLSHCEPYVLQNLEAIISLVSGLRNTSTFQEKSFRPSDYDELLTNRTKELLGEIPPDRDVRIMVTLPTEAAYDPAFSETLLNAGMNIARINCAHDSEHTWQKMIDNIKFASQKLHLPCRILMDIPGPKIRTVVFDTKLPVRKIKPERNELGHLIAPTIITLNRKVLDSESETFSPSVIPLADFTNDLPKETYKVRFRDSRGAKRSFKVKACENDYFTVECDKTAYFLSGLELHFYNHHDTHLGSAKIGHLNAIEAGIRLSIGDHLIIAAESQFKPLHKNKQKIPVIGCTYPDVFSFLEIGQECWLDDGKIGCKILEISADHIVVRINKAPPRGAAIRSDKGINFPNSSLNIPALTKFDISCLPFVAKNADMIGFSFVQSPKDIIELRKHLIKLGREDLALVLKVETRKAFSILPKLLLAAMRFPKFGVMIARGDLAVECGYTRLAEIQEEILWLCQATHIPVIWATQVLESLTKKGQPSRAEVTDAAMAERAECVMLNKGPFLREALLFLDDVLLRMKRHLRKKRNLLPSLQIATDFFRN